MDPPGFELTDGETTTMIDLTKETSENCPTATTMESDHTQNSEDDTMLRDLEDQDNDDNTSYHADCVICQQMTLLYSIRQMINDAQYKRWSEQQDCELYHESMRKHLEQLLTKE